MAVALSCSLIGSWPVATWNEASTGLQFGYVGQNMAFTEKTEAAKPEAKKGKK